MDEVLSPMVEMSVKRSREYPAEENRFSNTSTDYTDEVIQDFRMSIAMPVLPGWFVSLSYPTAQTKLI